MFEEKSLEEISKMTLEEQTAYQKEKKEFEAQALKTQIEEATKDSAKKEDIDKLTAKNTEVIKEIERLGLELKKLNDKPKESDNAKKTVYGTILEAFEAKKSEVEELISGKSKGMSVKAVVNITDATTVDSIGSENHLNLTQNTGIISIIRQRILRYLSSVSTSTMTGNRVNWMEELDEEGNPIFIAEAQTKTKISVRYEEREAKSKKIGVYSKVSTEFLRNLPQLVSHVKNNMMKRVDIATENQLFGGDGLSNNLNGLTEYATAFTGGSLSGTMTDVANADVFRAIALQVEEAYGTATKLFVRPSILAGMDVEKTEDGNYLLPPFRSANGAMVAGIELVSSTGLPSGIDFIGGDLSVVQVRFADSMSIQVDLSGTDFIDNLRTILVEQELVQWVSANDTQVLVQGSMADAIETLTVGS